jgi:putative transposase
VGARSGEARPAAARVGRFRRAVPPVSAVVVDGPCQGHSDQISPLLASELAVRIGQKIEISWDERTIQHVYADLDGRYVELPVIGDYPDVWEADWEAARAGVRALGRAYQADGGRAATARAVAAANQEIHRARVRTKEARRQAKRREGEGATVADLRRPKTPAAKPVIWKPAAELGEDWDRIG